MKDVYIPCTFFLTPFQDATPFGLENISRAIKFEGMEEIQTSTIEDVGEPREGYIRNSSSRRFHTIYTREGEHPRDVDASDRKKKEELHRVPGWMPRPSPTKQ